MAEESKDGPPPINSNQRQNRRIDESLLKPQWKLGHKFKDVFKPTGETLDTEDAIKDAVHRNEIPPRRTFAFRAAVSRARAALGMGSKPEELTPRRTTEKTSPNSLSKEAGDQLKTDILQKK